MKIKGLCEVTEPQYEQDYSPSIKRYKPYRSRSPDNRHPPSSGSSTCPRSNSNSTHNPNPSGQDTKSGHKSSGQSHSINSESVSVDNGTSSVVVLESHDINTTQTKEGKSKMTSLGMGVGIVSKLSVFLADEKLEGF